MKSFPINCCASLDNPPGQRKDYAECVPHIYRNATDESLLIDRIKLNDFALTARTFPPVYYAEKLFRTHVDMLALAQHYGMPTDMVDLTSDIAVAAFFATTRFDTGRKRFVPIRDSIGSISRFFYMPFAEHFVSGLNEDYEFRVVGLQPFARPGQQCAFGLKLQRGQSLEQVGRGTKLLFYQHHRCGEQFLSIFGEQAANQLFPEESIAEAAEKIRKTPAVTEAAVDLYCSEYRAQRDDVLSQLRDCGIDVVSKPVFRLPRKEEEKLRRRFRNHPFGEVPILTRLMCLPGGDDHD